MKACFTRVRASGGIYLVICRRHGVVVERLRSFQEALEAARAHRQKFRAFDAATARRSR